MIDAPTKPQVGSKTPYKFRFVQDDPLKVIAHLWPHYKLAKFQEEMLYSFWFNKETVVAAANMLGKDFTLGLGLVTALITRHPCRIVTTSSNADHLRVLWGEINRHIQESKFNLRVEKGGMLFINHQEIRKYDYDRKGMCPLSYMIAKVASDDTMAAMGGHHIANTGDGIFRTVWAADEASGVKTQYRDTVGGWANRIWSIGNTWDCDNYFRHAFEGTPGSDDQGGDLLSETGLYYVRKCLRLKAEDSPNIRLAKAQIASGKVPTGEMLVPGLKGWEEYQENRKTWDPIQQSIKLDAQWYKGKEVKLFPQEWLDRAAEIGRQLRGATRKAKAIGIDPAEGGDKTVACVIDELGVIELVSVKTPDTADVQDLAVKMFLKHQVPQSKVFFDAGGGGKQHVDSLKRQGYNFQAIAFGESVTLPPQRAKRLFDERVDNREDRGAYVNRRAMMYGEASILLDPVKRPEFNGPEEDESDSYDADGNLYKVNSSISVRAIQTFGIPMDGPQYGELVRQLAAMPKRYVEGRLYLPPKSRKGEKANSGEKTLSELLGRSPDEADAFVLAVYAMTGKRAPFILKGY